MGSFVHLHVHTQYSILDGASDIKELISKAKNDNMPALAITDHGNMFGVKTFHAEAKKAGIKPIIGCEAYVARTSRLDKASKEDLSGEHLILLAKNNEGYHNLVKLVTYAYVEGFYSKPRIDKELLRKYHSGIIASSACIAGEVPRAIINGDLKKAENTIKEFINIFGDDYYLELQRHKTDDPNADQEVFQKQQIANKGLIELAKKLNVKLIATNDVHFVNAEDAEAHDRLLCINTGTSVKDSDRMKYTKQEYLKSTKEMEEIFSDIPEALENTIELTEKIEVYDLDHKPIMPDFPMPENFSNPDDYLRHLTFEGAEKRYSDLTQNIKERIEFELETIKKMGYPGYFLIVQDFLNAARGMGVWVGPGRGSAAGSVVAYCLKITDVDPIKYDLLFERFLNPDRISLPDIDIDFDEDGRERVMKWVVEKYGADKVAQIITFGTMAAKMAIRDVARVQELPLKDADRLAKLVPERPGISLKDAFSEVKELSDAKKSDNNLISQTLHYAERLEGTIRNVGTHACGVIIGRDPLIEHIPLYVAKDAGAIELVTQYEGSLVEQVGMLKMDFLGLKTLSIIKDAIENVKLSRNIDVAFDDIPFDDEKTFKLYSDGDTTGVFQFESEGMKKYLRELKPNKFEDIIAMNALYRPGPMDYIPKFISRKQGKEPIEYDIPDMQEYLEETYGITVYQEQVMLLSRKLAGFSRGESDTLRKAMGKKQKDTMDKLKSKFIEGGKNNGHDEKILTKIWGDWEAFAQYAFNKSHSTCYAYLSYKMAYMKAHYPSEFMAAVLSRNLHDIKKITTLMDECRRQGLNVLGPDVNESRLKFNVNKNGDIRFGLAAIKGVGENAALSIISERDSNGNYVSLFDFMERVNTNTVNKRCLEALAMSGSFDLFTNIKRYQYFCPTADGNYIETLIKYSNNFKTDKNTSQLSLFGEESAAEIIKPEAPDCNPWSQLETLNKEKDLIGIYISAHPLDAYKLEINHFSNITISELKEIDKPGDKEYVFAGIVTDFKEGTSKNGKPYATFSIEDYTNTYKFTLFSNDFVNFRNYLSVNFCLLIKGKMQVKPYIKTETEIEFKITSIELLTEVREKIKDVNLIISVTDINEKMIEALDKSISTNSGKTNVRFIIYDPLSEVKVNMFSRTKRVYLSKEFIEYLEKLPYIDFKIN